MKTIDDMINNKVNDKVNIALNTLGNQVSVIEKRFELHSEQITKISGGLENVKSRLTGIEDMMQVNHLELKNLTTNVVHNSA